MEVALSIAFAAFVGGVIFMLLDGWQRKRVAETATAAAPVADPAPPIWTPSGSGGWAPPSYERPQPAPPSAWPPPPERTEPLPPPRPSWEPSSEERTEPLPPRPLWTPPPSSGPPTRWDDDDRYRGHDDEDDPPPGLWSGWARR